MTAENNTLTTEESQETVGKWTDKPVIQQQRGYLDSLTDAQKREQMRQQQRQI